MMIIIIIIVKFSGENVPNSQITTVYTVQNKIDIIRNRIK